MKTETERQVEACKWRMCHRGNGQVLLSNGAGLSASLNGLGYLSGIGYENLLITRTEGTLSGGGLGRIYLRKHFKSGEVRLIQLTGSGGICRKYCNSTDTVTWRGSDEDLLVETSLRLNRNMTIDWIVTVQSTNEEVGKIDCIFGQDLGLADKAALQSNEAYVCHYVDQNVEQLPPYGPVLMYRQNLPQSGNRHPWFMLYSPTGAVAYATDAHDAFGNGHRIDGQPAFAGGNTLSSSKLQYEFNYPSLQSRKEKLCNKDSVTFRFCGIFQENHEEVSGPDDLAMIEEEQPEVIQLPETCDPKESSRTIFSEALPYPSSQPDRSILKSLYPGFWSHLEEMEDRILSFFTNHHRHIVTRDKEGMVDRPHGTILLGAHDLKWNKETTATTVYMNGIFNGQLISGNTSLHKLLSVSRESVGLDVNSGQRILVRQGTNWYRLGTPSIFEIGKDQVHWTYMSKNLPRIDVQAAIAHNNRDINLSISLAEPLDEVVITNELVMGEKESDLDATISWDPDTCVCSIETVRDSSGGIPSFSFTIESDGGNPGILKKFPSTTGITNILDFSFQSVSRIAIKVTAGSGGHSGNPTFWESATNGLMMNHPDDSVTRMDEALSWYAHNALIHYLSPHGLEQYTGAAWGTRDVCQGPLEFLLANGHVEEAKDVILRTFAAQYLETGDWPQWFMLDEYGVIAQDHAHGDIILWPLKALALYIHRTGDLAILEESVDYRLRNPVNQAANDPAPLRDHLYKAIDHLKQQFISGTHLVSYGDGDWDDSLQPAQSQLRKRLVSSWTVALCAQVATELADALRDRKEKELVSFLDQLRLRIESDFRQYLLVNGTLCGFLLFDENLENPEPLIHPDDSTTGIDLRLIPINRAIISGLFTRKEAEQHLKLVHDKLKYPDGVRLMTKPASYTGGKEHFFRRAESAANFGREIGLQYVHAHIRYAEALAIMGWADELWDAVQVINPVGLTKSVANAMPRQSNMYFSSSDGDFRCRLDAANGLHALKAGKVQAKGGWRLYSSGPGIYTALIIERVLGLRSCMDCWEIDPVLPAKLNGLQIDWKMEGTNVSIFYDISAANDSTSIEVNGTILDSTSLQNNYRFPGIRIRSADLRDCLNRQNNKIIIYC